MSKRLSLLHIGYRLETRTEPALLLTLPYILQPPLRLRYASSRRDVVIIILLFSETV